jgi:hypothetical protein
VKQHIRNAGACAGNPGLTSTHLQALKRKGDSMTRIIVEIEGGLVQAVWSTDQGIDVNVMNRDIPENDEDADEYVQQITQLESDIRNLNMVDIS